MKKWTNNFIHKRRKDGTCSYIDNAKAAARSKLKISEELYVELSKEIQGSNLLMAIQGNNLFDYQKIVAAIMIGFVIGWAEKSRSIK